MGTGEQPRREKADSRAEAALAASPPGGPAAARQMALGREIAAEERALGAAAAEIRRLVSRATLAFHAEVGRIILSHFYGGDPARWHAHGRKGTSIRRLAEILDDSIGLSAPVLCRAVQTHLILLRLGRSRDWSHILPSHVRLVLALPEVEQDRLLVAAEEGAWTALELRERAGRKAPPRAGVAAVDGATRRVRRSLDAIDRGRRALGEIDPASLLRARVLDDSVRRMVGLIEGLEHVLHRVRSYGERARRTPAHSTDGTRTRRRV